MFDDAEIIYSYTRAQALEDGALVAVPDATAQGAGFVFPVAITAAVWADCVAWTSADTDRIGIYQDQEGRLWDVLYMAVKAIGSGSGYPTTGRARYQLHRWARDSVYVLTVDADGFEETPEPPLVELVAVCGPGDDGAPVITIMQPGED